MDDVWLVYRVVYDLNKATVLELLLITIVTSISKNGFFV